MILRALNFFSVLNTVLFGKSMKPECMPGIKNNEPNENPGCIRLCEHFIHLNLLTLLLTSSKISEETVKAREVKNRKVCYCT
jgi:hypothetical protein